MFERPHHRQIARILGALDAARLAQVGCLFGGGTAMALRYGEYRQSVDIDFLISNVDGYRQLRQWLTGPSGIAAITRPKTALKTLRDIRADQYGLRTVLESGGSAIKLEIVLEARLTLDLPGEDDQINGVATLSTVDMAASKLLANADRWADDSVFSRDLIDLAMMQPDAKLLRSAVSKARLAYGDSAMADVQRAIEHLRGRTGRLERCMEALQMTLPRALVWQRVKAMAVKVQRLP